MVWKELSFSQLIRFFISEFMVTLAPAATNSITGFSNPVKSTLLNYGSLTLTNDPNTQVYFNTLDDLLGSIRVPKWTT